LSIQGASQRLDKFPANVEEFVEHLNFLGKMSTELPALEKEFSIVNKMFTIARDYSVAVHPEELALYKTLAPSFQHLKVSVHFCICFIFLRWTDGKFKKFSGCISACDKTEFII
jgi:dynein heavy chain